MVEAVDVRDEYAHCSKEVSVSPSTSQSKGDEDLGSSSKVELGYEKVFRQPVYTFILPNLDDLPHDFRAFLEDDLIETSTLQRLEKSGHLNWWCWNGSGQRLWPLSTTGDGNCLLHAASLEMWGIQDRQLILRKCLHEMMTKGSRRQTLYRRWRWAESKSNLQSGLKLSEKEWHNEWNNLLKMADATPRVSLKSNDEANEEPSNAEEVYDSLEGIHVFALAHIVKRPIIGNVNLSPFLYWQMPVCSNISFVSDTVLRNVTGEELSPISFGGIYLPLECPASQCHRTPLVLCYDSSHFSALVTMQRASSNTLQPIIPVTDSNRNLLPLHFSVDPGPDFTWWRDAEDKQIAAHIELSEEDQLSLICEYMDIVKVEVHRNSFRRRNYYHHLETGRYDDFSKSATVACMDCSGTKTHSLNILSELTLLLKKRIKFPGKKKKRCKHCMEEVSVSDLRCSSTVVAAQLYSSPHEYVDNMVQNYLSLARERFEQSKNTPSARQRARLSRSFSVSSSNIVCINVNCQQMGSQTTNFLCNDCFEYQKQMMTSFGFEQPGHVRSLRPVGKLPIKADSFPAKKSRSISDNSTKSGDAPVSNLPTKSLSNTTEKTSSKDKLHTLAVHSGGSSSELITTQSVI
uniref:ubiquitinyl hydrolase 1 n=1 Tax=Syphacia muris TaxID=451379 RepID=A0A0N5AA75_9BILA